MVEQWRIKKYYDKRQMIETQRVITPQFDNIVVCLTGSDLEMLRNLMPLLRWRTSFVSEYHTNHYLCPDNADWDLIQGLVADLERRLMGGEIEALITAIEAQTDVIDVLRQCVCETAAWQQKQASMLPDLNGYVGNEDVTYLSPSETEGTFTPPETDTLRCELAQAIWWYTYELHTEILLPFADTTSDRLTSLVVGAVGFGALAGFVGIPVAVLSAIVIAIVAWGVSGSISNLVNWFLATKDEIICILYDNLPDTSTAATLVRAYVNDQSELSFLEKAVINSVLASSWHYGWICKDQQENDTWRDYFVQGQCQACEEYPEGCIYVGPCVLADWTDGTVGCIQGRAAILGALSYWTKHTFVPGPGTYLVVYYYPRANGGGYPYARANWGFTKVSNLTHTIVIAGQDKARDVLQVEYAAIPAGLWGIECYFHMQQVGFWCSPVYVCILDAPPE